MKDHLSTALGRLYDGCDRAIGLRGIYEYLSGRAPAALNCDDILRSSLILAVSSFDLYLHDIIRTEILFRINSKKKVESLRLPFNLFLLNGISRVSAIEECIRKDNSYKSFVAPDKLADCLRPLVNSPWEKIADALNEPLPSCRNQLKNIVDLRNRIAHEADVNPNYGGIELWPIYSQDVEASIIFLRTLGAAIARVVNDN